MRAEQVAGARPHRRQARAARAAQQPQQERLGLVVAGVGDGDRGGALPLLDLAQEGVALARAPPPRVPPVSRRARARTSARRRREGDARAARTAPRRRPRPPPSPAAGRGRGGRPRRGSRGRGQGRPGRRAGPPSRRRRTGRPRPSAPARGRPAAARGPWRTAVVEGRPSHGEVRLQRGSWWRCRDLNPGHRGYEPRALTS